MSALYSPETTTAWLRSQLVMLEAWINDLALDPMASDKLVDCLSEHKTWLTREMTEIESRENTHIYPLSFGT